MQPSKQLRGLVESYSDVYGDRDQRNALRAECKSIINCVGVHMVESGFTEQDVKEFLETASIGKILQKFEESQENEKVVSHLNDEGLFETNRVNIPGACAARINESILGRIIREAYTVNVADKKGNTKAYQNYKAGMKNKLTGKPLYKAGPGVEEAKNGGDNDPCWDTHKQVGMKKKGGKMVPNCVPKEEAEQVDEADSLAAMAARREKRLAAQRKREGTTGAGHDFGHDYGITSAERKKRQDKEFDAFIGRGKKTKKEAFSFDEDDLKELDVFGEAIDVLSDEELVDMMEELILELAEDDQDLIEICEHLEGVEILSEDYYDSAVKASKEASKKPEVKAANRRARVERLKKAAGAAAKKVGSAAKAGVKAAAKGAVRGAGYASGLAQRASSSAKSEFKKGRERGLKSSGSSSSGSSSSSDDGTGGKLDSVLSSIRSEKPAKKKPSLLRRAAGAVGRGLKKAVGKAARGVSNAADRAAKKMGEAYKPIDKKKETAMYRRAGNLSRDALSKGMSTKAGSKAQDKSSNIVSAIARQKEKERFAKMGDEKARSNYGESVDKITFFLVSEGLADTFEGAERMIEGLSEDFINEILDLALIEEKMVQGIIEMGEAADADEARYILSELDEETLDALAEDVQESAEDRLRDQRMERGGVDGNTRYDRAPKAPNTKKFGTGKTMAQKAMEKKYGKGMSAMDMVKADIRAKYGKGSVK